MQHCGTGAAQNGSHSVSPGFLNAGQVHASLHPPNSFRFTDEAEAGKALGKSKALTTQVPAWHVGGPFSCPEGTRQKASLSHSGVWHTSVRPPVPLSSGGKLTGEPFRTVSLTCSLGNCGELPGTELSETSDITYCPSTLMSPESAHLLKTVDAFEVALPSPACRTPDAAIMSRVSLKANFSVSPSSHCGLQCYFLVS